MFDYALDVTKWKFVRKDDNCCYFKNGIYELIITHSFFSDETSLIYCMDNGIRRVNLPECKKEKFTEDFRKQFIEFAL